MHLRLTGDLDQESGLLNVVLDLSGPTKAHFIAKDYGAGLAGVVIVLICHKPELDFERRVRLSKNDKKLYMDVILDFHEMKAATSEKRERLVLAAIQAELPEVFSRYRIPDFDKDSFLGDLRSWLVSADWRNVKRTSSPAI